MAKNGSDIIRKQGEIRMIPDAVEAISTDKFKWAKFPFESFNPVQSTLFPFVGLEENVVVASSTSSGKTVCAELVMSHEIRVRGGKAVYLSPLKALAQEKYDDWTNPRHHFSDLKVSICTGDYLLTPERREELEMADIIVLSSEMLNSRCRNMRSENNLWLTQAGTLIIDESHLLTVAGRGHHLESGLIKFAKVTQGNGRFILLSATMPNVDEVGGWVSVLNGKRTNVIVSSYRPVELKIHWVPYSVCQWYDDTERSKVASVVAKVIQYPEDKFLIFAHTKGTGKMIVDALRAVGVESEFHNANLRTAERKDLEHRFKFDKEFKVLVATSTLAWGCHRVGTPIAMADGSSVPVQNLLPGDLLLSSDGKVLSSCRLLYRQPMQVQQAVKVVLENGSSCDVTKNHPFFALINGEGEWVQASELSPGMEVAVRPHVPNSGDMLWWETVASVSQVAGGEFWEIEVDGDNTYFGSNFLSHNCNTPARRVIIAGVHRGLQEVEKYDIDQEAGRAGRPQYDKEGDVYILLPNKDFVRQKSRLEKPIRITSQMVDPTDKMNHKTLGFHLVSEIYHGDVNTVKDVHEWFADTLAYYQNADLGDDHVDKVLKSLEAVGAIIDAGGLYEATAVGKVASLFYFSPYDVADLKKNFTNLFGNDREADDHHLSWSLANLDSHASVICSRAEMDVVSPFAGFLCKKGIVGSDWMVNHVLKGKAKVAYCYHSLLRGDLTGPLASQMYGMKADSGRLVQVLSALDAMAANWKRAGFWHALEKRLSLGIEAELIGLVDIKGIGAVRAKRLQAHGIKSVKDLADAKPARVVMALGCAVKTAEGFIAAAKETLS